MSEPLAEEELRDRASAWAASDPDHETRVHLEALLASTTPDALLELRSCFEHPLRFGTAGLRGPLGPGPARFNVALVCRAALALCRWLDASGIESHRPVLIGFDARHKSHAAALQAARVVRTERRTALLMPFAAPTPFTAFTARSLNAAASLMVTASHNPATDNGLKVFGPDHRQIVSPADVEIAALLDAVDAVPEPVGEPDLVDIQLWLDYVDRCAALANSDRSQRSKVRVAYTAMHGVGSATLDAVFAACGFDLHVVVEQNDPDPEFPTTLFPNPEEPGAMDLVLDLAARANASVAVANDPDADRLACAVRTPDGSFRVLTGDELGCVLLWYLVEHRGLTGVVASTLVSSELASRICAARGLRHVVTPTGFKWLSRVDGLGYAYEESIGFCVDPDHVSDKDGISAAVLLVDMIAAGIEPVAVLGELDHRFGAYVQQNFSMRISPDHSTRLQDALLNGGRTSFAGFDVFSIEDLASDPTRPGPGVRMRLTSPGSAARVVLRPSGTEAKTKVYIEVSSQVRTSSERQAAGLCVGLQGLADTLR